MKKFLLTAVLILAVLTSLTAGTLASYTQTQTIDSKDIDTIFFKFTTTGQDGFDTVVSLAPGLSKTYKVNFENSSEVPVAFTTAAQFIGINNNDLLPYLQAEWVDSTGKAANTSFTISNGEFNTHNLFLKVTFTDTANNAAEVALSQADAKAKVRVNVVGTSVHIPV